MIQLTSLRALMWSFIITLAQLKKESMSAVRVPSGMKRATQVRPASRRHSGVSLAFQGKMKCSPPAPPSHQHSSTDDTPPPAPETGVSLQATKTEITNTLRWLITNLRATCRIWKRTMRSWLNRIKQILLDGFIWLSSKRESLPNFCLQSCTILPSAAAVSWKQLFQG